jgi:hypothetical protein
VGRPRKFVVDNFPLSILGIGVDRKLRWADGPFETPGARNGSLKAVVRIGASLLLSSLNVFSRSLASHGTRRELGAPLRVNGKTLSLWICPGFYFNSIREPRRTFTFGLHKARELGLRHAHWFAPALRDPVAQIRSGGHAPDHARSVGRHCRAATRIFIEKNDLQVSNLDV